MRKARRYPETSVCFPRTALCHPFPEGRRSPPNIYGHVEDCANYDSDELALWLSDLIVQAA